MSAFRIQNRDELIPNRQFLPQRNYFNAQSNRVIAGVENSGRCRSIRTLTHRPQRPWGIVESRMDCIGFAGLPAAADPMLSDTQWYLDPVRCSSWRIE